MSAQGERPLDARELGAWRGFLRVHARLVRELDRELQAAHGLQLHAYEVLLFLDGAPGGRLRMSELADSVLLSQSGLTRLVDRLVRDGLVDRERCDDDRRGLYARLTPAGRRVFRAARATHLRGVRDRFLSRFDEAQQDALAELWERVEPGASR